MTPSELDRVFGRARLRMVTGEHVEVFREASAPGERRRYTKRFLATPNGDYREWTEREWRILARLVGHGIRSVPDVVQFDRGASDRSALVQTYDAGITVDHWATLLPLERDGAVVRNLFKDCAHWWTLARHTLLALDAIHELNLVHLDLKADNICIPVDPVGFEPLADSEPVPLHPRFADLTLIDFAFSLVTGERLVSALPIAPQPSYEYQSPRLLEALEIGRSGDLGPTRHLDWRCDIFSLAAMLRRCLPRTEDAAHLGWTPRRHAEATAFVQRLADIHDQARTTMRPHAQLISLASEALAEPELRRSLQRGWPLALDAASVVATATTPITRIAPPLAATAEPGADPDGTAGDETPVAADAGRDLIAGSRPGGERSPVLETMAVSSTAARPGKPLEPRIAEAMTAFRARREARDQQRPPPPMRWFAAAGTGLVAIAIAALVPPVWDSMRRGPPFQETTVASIDPGIVATRSEPLQPASHTSASSPEPEPLPAADSPAAAPEADPASAAPISAQGTAGRTEDSASSAAAASASGDAARHGVASDVRQPARSARPGATVVAGAPAKRAPDRTSGRGRTPTTTLAADTSRSRTSAATGPAAREAMLARARAGAASQLREQAVLRPATGTPAQASSSARSVTAEATTAWAVAGRVPPSSDGRMAAPETGSAPAAVSNTTTAPPERLPSEAHGIDPGARADRLMTTLVPRVAQRAERTVARALFAAARSSAVVGDEDVTRAAAAIGSASAETSEFPAALREAQSLASAARNEFARHGASRDALLLQVRAFGANPSDPDVAGYLAFLLLRQRPAQADAARQLALYALMTRGSRYPMGRSEDWATLAIANALLGRERDAHNAMLVGLAVAPSIERRCRAALDTYAAYGDRMRGPVEELLRQASAATTNSASLCEWPPHWAANAGPR